jgi:hypothetical protein
MRGYTIVANCVIGVTQLIAKLHHNTHSAFVMQHVLYLQPRSTPRAAHVLYSLYGSHRILWFNLSH